MLLLAFRNLVRRPLRSLFAIFGLGMSVAILAGLSAFQTGYGKALNTELDRMGLQMMLVPLGCPYDAAAHVLKGHGLDNSLPEAALEQTRRDPAVAVAAPLFMATLPRPNEGRADMWVGLDESALALKPWWRVSAGQKWFTESNSVILGCDAAEIELRAPGDWFYSPETGQKLRVAGILQRSGTSDDSLFFVPLATAQDMFDQPGRLTAIAIRLRDPALVREAADRLQNIPGAQTVTLTEMMGTFLNLVGAVRSLLLAVAIVALAISVLTVFNTLLAAVIERTNELSVMRAIGASRLQITRMIAAEALLLTGAGSIAGVLLAAIGGHGIENIVKQFVPFAPQGRVFFLSASIMWQSVFIGALAGLAAGVYPSWRAGRLHPAGALRTPQ